MPNNGIVTKRTNIPAEFRANSISEFNAATDMVVVNKDLDGFNVEQKSVTVDQLSEIIGVPYKSIILKIKSDAGGNFASPPVFYIVNEIYDNSGLTYSVGATQIATNASTQCVIPINFTEVLPLTKIYATGISNSAAQPLDIIASIADNDTINYHVKQMDSTTSPIEVPANFQFSLEIRIYN
jgi:hypothetical protein